MDYRHERADRAGARSHALSALERFTTRMVPPDRRRQYWCELVAQTFPGMIADVPMGIRADLARCSLGGLEVARATSDRARVERARDVRDDRNLVFHLQRHGSMMLRQKDSVVTAGAGDILIADEATPYAIDISDHNDCVIVHIPAPLLGTEIAMREWHAHRLDGGDPHVALLGRLLEGLWAEHERIGQLDDGMDGALAHLARIACLRAREGAASRNPIDYAMAHLHDPELGTARIAGSTGLSARAIQKAFARHAGCSPTAFIAEQRLQRAAAMLRAGDDRSITRIAFDIGFSDSAFFARCFGRRFGMTPSAWRLNR